MTSFSLPILMYHDVAASATDYLTISQARLEQHLAWVAAKYKPLTLQEAFDAWQIGKPVKDGTLITFDDGYAGVYHYAWPVLKEYHIPSVLFLTTRYLGHDNSWNARAVTKKQHLSMSEVQDMAANKEIFFGAHGSTHHHLTKFTEERINWELLSSKTKIEEITGRPVMSCAYPYGSFNDRVLTISRNLFQISFAANHAGVNDWCVNPHAIKRIYVRPQTTTGELDAVLTKHLDEAI